MKVKALLEILAQISGHVIYVQKAVTDGGGEDSLDKELMG